MLPANHHPWRRVGFVAAMLVGVAQAFAAQPEALPSPLALVDVVKEANAHRGEIAAAQARARVYVVWRSFHLPASARTQP